MPRRWQEVRTINPETLPKYDLNDILDMLSVVHPETSYSLWQFLRIANSKLTFKAKTVTGEDSKRGQRVLDQIIWKQNHPPSSGRFEESRGMNKIAQQLLLNAMVRGALGCELSLTADVRMDKIIPFDTGTFYFKTENERLVPYQYQNAPGSIGYIKMDYPTIFYEAIDPAIGDPYGRNPLGSLVSIVVFQLQFLADLKAAVHQIGYPRMSAKLVEEIAKKNAPSIVANDPKKFRDWANTLKNDVQTMLQGLNPEDIPVFWDSLELDIIGKGGGGQMIKIDSVIEIIENSLAAALKSLRSILGRATNTSKEGYAAELKLYSRGIESIQQLVEDVLERALTMALNLEGVRGWVDVEFESIDLRSELQVVAEKQTRQDIAITARMRGSISDYEEMKLHRDVLGLIGEPENWEELVNERKEREKNGGQQETYPKHGSPPANQ